MPGGQGLVPFQLVEPNLISVRLLKLWWACVAKALTQMVGTALVPFQRAQRNLFRVPLLQRSWTCLVEELTQIVGTTLGRGLAPLLENRRLDG